MIKFLVVWAVVSTFNAPCPATEPVCDEFGRCPYPMVTLAMACFDSTTTEHSKEFDSVDDAREFIRKAKEQECDEIGFTTSDCLKDITLKRIETIELK